MVLQASFKLSWNLKGENGNQYKHDVVSFDRGNITTAERSSKQVIHHDLQILLYSAVTGVHCYSCAL